MHLKHLSLTNFRNFSRLDLDVPARTVLLVGSNAQGKTSLLEAVYFLAARGYLESEVKIVEGAGHAPFLSRSDDFNSLLSSFLEEIYEGD